jgi:glycosyltransferase involved in cell wall biosynthesis
MRILHVITGLNGGGAETQLCGLTRRLKAGGFEQRVISLLGEGPLSARIRDGGVECIHLGLRRGRPSLGAFAALAREIRDYEPAVVHGWMYHACIYATIASSLTKQKPPLLWSIHHAHLGFAHNSLSTLAASASCGLLSFDKRVHIAYCAEASQKAHETRGYCSRRASFIPNGYDPATFFRDPAAGRSVRARFGLPEDAVAIGMAGRFDPIKDHATFFEAAGIVRRSESAKLVFFLFGEGITESNHNLMNMIGQYGLTSSVVLAGRQDDMVATYSALDFLVSSSRGEAFPNVICEGMLCEVPCVATDVGDCRAIIGNSGYIVPAGTPGALGQSLCSAVNLPVEVRRGLGASARARITERYSAEAFLSRHVSAYLGLVRDGQLPAEPCMDTNAL